MGSKGLWVSSVKWASLDLQEFERLVSRVCGLQAYGGGLNHGVGGCMDFTAAWLDGGFVGWKDGIHGWMAGWMEGGSEGWTEGWLHLITLHFLGLT